MNARNQLQEKECKEMEKVIYKIKVNMLNVEKMLLMRLVMMMIMMMMVVSCNFGDFRWQFHNIRSYEA